MIFEMVVVARVITGITFVFTTDTIVIPIITFRQGIFNYIPETNHISRV